MFPALLLAPVLFAQPDTYQTTDVPPIPMRVSGDGRGGKWLPLGTARHPAPAARDPLTRFPRLEDTLGAVGLSDTGDWLSRIWADAVRELEADR